MPDPVKIPAPLATPDPSSTVEVLIAYLTGLVADIFVIFHFDLNAAQKGAISGAITTVILLGTLAYSAYVRGQRAKAGGVVGGFLLDVPHQDGDDSKLGK